MRRYLLFSLLLLAGTASAQTSTGVKPAPQLGDLRAPTAPGFVLLGKAPAQVDRPTTPHGIATTLLGGLQGQDFALSAAPYWLVQHPNLTFEKYTNGEAKVDFACFYRDAGVSLAVVTDAASNRNAGFGLRTNLFRVRQPVVGALLKRYADRVKLLMPRVATDPANAALRDSVGQYRRLIEQAVTEFENKPVLLVSLAGAYAYRLPEGDRRGDLRRGGAWLDVAWRPAPRLEVMGVARWQNLVTGPALDRRENAWDYGLRAGGEFSLGAAREWLFSAEYVRRLADSGNTYRLAVVNEVEVTDNIYFTATFGEDFGNGRNVISLFGLNFGITTDSQLKAK